MTAEVHTDVLVVGAGAAGMYAAVEAARAGARVCLLDKSMVGRGGATIMAQMTVAAALGHAEPDSPEEHLADTVAGGKGLVDERLAAALCGDGPATILDTADMGVPWAREGGGKLSQVVAPGHSRRRCCYVGALQTGGGVSRGLRKELRRQAVGTRDGVLVTRLLLGSGGEVVGAAGLDVEAGAPVTFWAPAVVLACGGLTEMYERNSASVNLTGDAYALALDAGAALVDMEMVQFFPIASLAPRIVGLDPIMWDPFRYRFGGRLLNGEREEFVERYAGVADEGSYTATRDVVTYGILKENEAGRGSPAGGAYLDFTGVDFDAMRRTFPAAIDRLLEQGVDLRERPVEVAPTAHYTIGGVRTDEHMATGVPGLYAAGEAVGGAHGANRLSGNAITEAFVFGARAGRSAAAHAASAGAARPGAPDRSAAAEAAAEVAGIRGRCAGSEVFLPALRARLQQVMWRQVGPLRDAEGLAAAGARLSALGEELDAARVDARRPFNLEWKEYFEFRGMLRVAEAVRAAALARTESRGAHQREDHPQTLPEFARNTVVRAGDGGLDVGWSDVPRAAATAAAAPGATATAAAGTAAATPPGAR